MYCIRKPRKVHLPIGGGGWCGGGHPVAFRPCVGSRPNNARAVKRVITTSDGELTMEYTSLEVPELPDHRACACEARRRIIFTHSKAEMAAALSSPPRCQLLVLCVMLGALFGFKLRLKRCTGFELENAVVLAGVIFVRLSASSMP